MREFVRRTKEGQHLFRELDGLTRALRIRVEAHEMTEERAMEAIRKSFDFIASVCAGWAGSGEPPREAAEVSQEGFQFEATEVAEK